MMKNQKQLFNLNEDIHYLNCAYKAPLLKSSENAGIKALIRDRNPADITPSDFFNETEDVRVLFGKIVNCLPSEVAIIPSASYGFSSALNNITCTRGQHAIVVDNDFPSDYFSIKRWCDTNMADLKIIKANNSLELNGEIWNNDIIDSINEKTALVLLSSIHWMNGLKFDLENIGEKCRSVGAKFIVDGTQSVGVLPMDVKKFNIDALICPTYKWLFGPYSLGLAYFGSYFHHGKPIEESWLNRTNALDFNNVSNYDPKYKPYAGRYNVGETPNFILMPMLKQALIQVNKWLDNDIQSYSKELIKPLISYLQDLGVKFENSAYFSNHLFGLKLPEEVNAKLLKENLIKNNIYLSVRGKSIRVSIHVFNTSEDIEKLIKVIELTKKSRS
ncbi:aminotransferase class V [Flavobacteriales bacterium 34_180_T64]|nr:aminotransferase class V [Flavobacteriales bacterium 34_180_T64]